MEGTVNKGRVCPECGKGHRYFISGICKRCWTKQYNRDRYYSAPQRVRELEAEIKKLRMMVNELLNRLNLNESELNM